MANEIIRKHSFELAKSNIQSLSTKVPSSVSLESFPTEGSIFSWNDHNITGSEANSLLVRPLQETLITQNTSIKDLFNIAGEVYKALDSLDNEYISGIIASVKAAEIASDQAKIASSKAEKASNQALDASSQALEASKKATIAQGDIKRTIEALQKTVGILKNFKESVTQKIQSVEQNNEKVLRASQNVQSVGSRLSALHHLWDIDKVWEDSQTSKSTIKGLIDNIIPFMEKVNNADKELRGKTKTLESFLADIKHIKDVDALWNDVEGHKTNLSGLHEQVDAFVAQVDEATEKITSDIAALQQYRTCIESYKHLGDVDAIWNEVEGHKTNLSGLHEQVDAFVGETHKVEDSLRSAIDMLDEKHEEQARIVNKRLKIAYAIAGGAASISIIQLILQLTGIL